MQYFIKDDAKRPHVNSIGVIMKLGLFGCDVLLSACDGLHDYLLGAEPKICKFYQRERFASRILGLEEYILWLEIAMSDPVIVQFLHSLADLQDTL